MHILYESLEGNQTKVVLVGKVQDVGMTWQKERVCSKVQMKPNQKEDSEPDSKAPDKHKF